ncbi:MAG TPA: CoA pyrophosphatase [Solirubrobacteraceae bacterium]|nr:CoA pyrophosphatase [Solirubrobacteraceae bacterium]
MTDARALRAVLLEPAAATTLELHGQVEAAVLVPLYLRDDVLHAVLTLRHDELRHHPGQISFPGGRRDPTDPDLVHTALREAHEEIGLDPADVELLGALQPASTFVTDFAVYPFVGLIGPAHRFTPAPREVEAVIELPIPDLAATYARRTLTRNGREFRTDCYHLDGHLVWGATARILVDLLERLDRIPPRTASRPAPLPAES